MVKYLRDSEGCDESSEIPHRVFAHLKSVLCRTIILSEKI